MTTTEGNAQPNTNPERPPLPVVPGKVGIAPRYNDFRPYETPWLWPDSVPNEGDNVNIGSNQFAEVIKVTDQYIYLNNKRSFRR